MIPEWILGIGALNGLLLAVAFHYEADGDETHVLFQS